MEYKVATRQCRDDRGKLRIFHYFLTVDLEGTSRFAMENYGVRITEEDGDACTLPALTANPSRIDELMTILVDNLVGPVGLADVVQDWLQLTPGPFYRCADPASASAVPTGQ